jgi:hypothetical protein
MAARAATTRLLVCTLLCTIACTFILECNLKSALEGQPVCEPFKLPSRDMTRAALAVTAFGWALTLIFAVSRFAEWIDHENKNK